MHGCKCFLVLPTPRPSWSGDETKCFYSSAEILTARIKIHSSIQHDQDFHNKVINHLTFSNTSDHVHRIELQYLWRYHLSLTPRQSASMNDLYHISSLLLRGTIAQIKVRRLMLHAVWCVCLCVCAWAPYLIPWAAYNITRCVHMHTHNI